jgi:ABC-type branched-subunit amino acid transport system substrate-binding protein
MAPRKSQATRRNLLKGGALLLAGVGCPHAARAWHEPDHNDANYAMATDRTGALAAFGIDAARGFELALEHVNEAYRTERGRLRFTQVVIDGGSDPVKAVRGLARVALEEHPVLLIDAQFSGASSAGVMRLAEERKIPMLSALVAPVRPQPLAWSYSLPTPAARTAERTMRYLADIRIGVSRVVLAQYRAPNPAVLASYQAAAGQIGAEVIIGPNIVSSDFRGFNDIDAEAWVVPLVAPAERARLFDAVKNLTRPKIIVVNAFADPSLFVDELQSAKVVIATDFVADIAAKREFARSIVERYRAKYGSTMSPPAALAFTAVDVASRAVLKAGIATATRTYDDFQRALAELVVPAANLVMPWPSARFSGGENVDAAPVFAQIFDGAPATVWPPDLATRTLRI